MLKTNIILDISTTVCICEEKLGLRFFLAKVWRLNFSEIVLVGVVTLT